MARPASAGASRASVSSVGSSRFAYASSSRTARSTSYATRRAGCTRGAARSRPEADGVIGRRPRSRRARATSRRRASRVCRRAAPRAARSARCRCPTYTWPPRSSMRPGSQPRRIVGDGRRMHLEPCIVDRREGARLGGDAADARIHCGSILGPVEPAVVEGQLRAPTSPRRSAARRRRYRPRDRRRPVPPAMHRMPRATRAGALRSGCGRSASIRSRRRHRRRGRGRAGRHWRPRLLIPGDDGALHGRGAPPPRQQREVQVDPAEAGRAEQRLAHQPAVRDDHAEVGVESHDVVGHGTQAIGADHPDARRFRRGGNRRRGQHPLAALGRVLPGDDRDHLVRTGEEGPKARDRGRGTSREDDPKRGHGVDSVKRDRGGRALLLERLRVVEAGTQRQRLPATARRTGNGFAPRRGLTHDLRTDDLGHLGAVRVVEPDDRSRASLELAWCRAVSAAAGSARIAASTASGAP